MSGEAHGSVEASRARSEAMGLRLVAHHDLGGAGDGSRIDKHGDHLFVAHMSSRAFSVLDVADPTRPELVHQEPVPPHTHSHKVQIAGDVLLVNNEQEGSAGACEPGIRIFDVSRPARPREIAFFRTHGKGVHRMWFADGRYAYLPTAMDGYTGRILLVVDLADPTAPREVGRWSIPGTHAAAGERGTWPATDDANVHGPIVEGDRAYVALWDAGWAILDVSDPARPRTISMLNWRPPYGGETHTVLPLRRRGLAIVADESTEDDCREGQKLVWVVDIRDETRPVPIATLPVPSGDFCARGGHFGPHNLHENRPGSWQDDALVYTTYMNAGLRVYDISDPYHPVERAFFVPPAPEGGTRPVQMNDIYVDANGLIYCTDRYRGGLYVLEYEGPRPAAPALPPPYPRTA